MKIKKKKIVGLFLVVALLMGWGLLRMFKEVEDTGTVEVAVEPDFTSVTPDADSQVEEKWNLSENTEENEKERLMVSKTPEESASVSKKAAEYYEGKTNKEPRYLNNIKRAGIDVKGHQRMSSVGEVVSEYYDKIGSPQIERKFTNKLPADAIPGEIIVAEVNDKDDGGYNVQFGLVRVSPGKEIETIGILSDDPDVIIAEPNIRIKVQTDESYSTNIVNPPEDADPNYDPDFEKQWALKKIKADTAWRIEKGSKAVKIAVIDTGCDLKHLDLKDNIDLTLSYDYVNNDAEPQDDYIYSHGTHIAGVIAAVGGNGIGGQGVMWNASLIILKVLNSKGTLVISTEVDAAKLANALTDAVARGARIINMSWATDKNFMAQSETLRLAFESTFKKDVLLVAGSGNHKEQGVLYPARYNGVFAVGGTGINDNRWVSKSVDKNGSPDPNAADYNPCYDKNYESAYGDEIDVSAPAESIYSTLITSEGEGEKYGYMSGTSMSTAFVSGLAGLLLSKNPGLTKEELVTLLKENVDGIQCGSGDDCNKLGTGRINAEKSLKVLGGGGTDKVEAVAYVGEKGNKDYTAEVGEEVKFFGEDSKKPEGTKLNFQWDFGDGWGKSQENVTHKYNKAGSYKIILAISTEDFETSVDSVNVTVSMQKEPKGNIKILGKVTKGDVSQEGVNVKMDLNDKDGNLVIAGSSATDSGGKFEIEFKDVNLDQNYSVDLLEPSQKTDILKNLSTGKHYTYDIKQSSGGDGGGGDGISAQCERCKLDAMGLSSEAINLQGPHSYGKTLDVAKQSIGEAIQEVSKDMQGCPNASSIQYWLNKAVNELSKKECMPGKDDDGSCANGGIKHRKCQYNGIWGSWGNCTSPQCEPSCEEQCPVGFLSECTDPINNTCACTRPPLEQKTDDNAYKYTCSECMRYYTPNDCQEKGWCQ